jgi:hypothetical protein
MVMRRRGPGLIRTAARTAVIAGTATAVSGRVQRHQQEKYYEEQTRMGVQPEYYAPPPMQADSEPEYVVELQRLAELQAKGVITQQEFEAKKRQLLGI